MFDKRQQSLLKLRSYSSFLDSQRRLFRFLLGLGAISRQRKQKQQTDTHSTKGSISKDAAKIYYKQKKMSQCLKSR